MQLPTLSERVTEVMRRIFVGYVVKRDSANWQAFMSDGTDLGLSRPSIAAEKIRDAYVALTPIQRYKLARTRFIARLAKRPMRRGGLGMGDRTARTISRVCLLEQEAFLELLFTFWDLQSARGKESFLYKSAQPKPIPQDAEVLRGEGRAQATKSIAEALTRHLPWAHIVSLHSILVGSHSKEIQPFVLALEDLMMRRANDLTKGVK